MKKILFNRIYGLMLCTILTAFLLSSCTDEADNALPVITEVRNYAASPEDTVITSLNDGQWVVLLGKNLSSVTRVYFGTIPANINTTMLTDGSVVVQVPTIPFLSVPKDKLNIITVVNEGGGTTTFEIKITGAPIIVNVRGAENGEILDKVFPDQQINIVGVNLENATSIAFQGIEADLSTLIYTDSSTIVQVPANLSGGDAAQVNTISYTTNVGAGTISIRIIGPPIITNVSHEFPAEGDSVALYGYNFVSVESITFAGATISSFKASEDGSSVKFVVPNLTSAGPVKIVTQGGAFTTSYNVNDRTFISSGGMGLLGNVEWGDYFGWQWWGGSVDLYSSDPASGWPPYSADYGVGTGMFMTLKSSALKAGEGDDGNAIRMGSYSWVPDANLDDSGDKWAFKFEMYVKKPWNGGTLCIKTNNASYLALYEPWKISATESIDFTTQGWQTVTIPLSSFRLAGGKGNSITKVSDLLDIATGKSSLTLYLHNYTGATALTSFEVAFDNFRVVKR